MGYDHIYRPNIIARHKEILHSVKLRAISLKCCGGIGARESQDMCRL